MGSARRSGAVGVLCVLMAAAVFAQEAVPELRAVRADVAPKMDGLLDDVAWSGQPVGSENWVSYNPLRGEPAAMRTRVWVAYDNDAIYFAFRCFDPEPGRIRTTITRRDNVWNDDWIGVSLDSSRAGQVAYHMFVNPSGIQMDALQTSSGEDTAPDRQWQTAGNVDAGGYTVEMRVPLQSLHRIVPALARQIGAKLFGPEILMQPNRHEAELIEQIEIDDHGRLDPIGFFFNVVRVMGEPASIDEEFAVPPHPVP